MPKKRPHRKSRFGCDQCRKRRVKCDEKLPRCSTCTDRDDECYYSRPPQPLIDVDGLDQGSLTFINSGACSTIGAFEFPGDDSDICMFRPSPEESCKSASARSGQPGQKENTSSPSNNSSVRETLIHATNSLDAAAAAAPRLSSRGSTGSTISDLALMHHWCTRTCHSFTPSGADLFREYVGSLALHHEYLMEALLALTLLHRATEREEKYEDASSIRPLVSDALERMNHSVSGLRVALSNMSPLHYDAIFTTSMLIMVCAILAPLVPSDLTGRGLEPATEATLLLANYMNGIASIVESTHPWIKQGPMSKILGIVRPEPIPGLRWDAAQDLRGLLDARMGTSDARYATMVNAITRLEMVYRRDHCAVEWMPRVGQEFTDELQRGDLMSMMILMHWGVLLYMMDDMWWKRYAGAKLVDELSGMLLGHDAEWDGLIGRCRQEVGLYQQCISS